MRSRTIRFNAPLGFASVARSLWWAVASSLVGLTLSALPCRAQFFNAVYSRDGLDVIAVGDSGAVYRSVSGGVVWSRGTLGDKPLRDVVAWSWNIVVVGDSGKVWRSADLGGTWGLVVVSGTPSLRRVERLSGGQLIAVGSGGTVVGPGGGGEGVGGGEGGEGGGFWEWWGDVEREGERDDRAAERGAVRG